jgi:hypothetical protein
VNEGLKRKAELLIGESTDAFKYCALGIDTTAEANTDASLGNEITSGGCARMIADTLQYVADYKAQLIAQWTITDTFAIAETAIFDNSALLIVEDCEDDAWDELVDGDVTSTLDAVTYKVGAKSCKLAVAANCGAGDILATEVVAKDLSTYGYVCLWLYSSVALDANDLQLLLDDHAQCASPTETINIPAVAATTWTLVQCDLANPASDNAIISIGIKMVVDKGAFDLYVDHVHAPGVMCMRHKFADAKNVINGDTLQLTFTETESRA